MARSLPTGRARPLVLSLGLVALGLVSASSARAGEGSSPAAIAQAIRSGSPGAIVAELERAERLGCLSCIDLVLPLIDHPEARVRDVAGWWLGRRGVRVQVLAELQGRLSPSEQDPIRARNAADVLGGMRDPAGLPWLTEYLGRPLDEESGRAAARALGMIGHPTSSSALLQAAASPLVGVATQALEALRQLRAPRGLRAVIDPAALVPSIGSAADGVRRQAILTIGHLAQGSAATSRSVVDALAATLANDPSAAVRRAAAWALGMIGDGSTSSALQAARSDVDPTVRSVARAAMGRIAR